MLFIVKKKFLKPLIPKAFDLVEHLHPRCPEAY